MKLSVLLLRYACVFLTPVFAACSDGGGYILETRPAANEMAPPPDDRKLVLPLEVDPQAAETFVRIGYGLNEGQRFQSTEFLTPRLRTTQAAPLIRLVKKYNEFDGERVAAAVEKFRGQVSGVQFGREGSPVLYLELSYWTHQRELVEMSVKGVRISDEDSEKLVGELKQIFVGDLKADEFSVVKRRVRIWWD